MRRSRTYLIWRLRILLAFVSLGHCTNHPGLRALPTGTVQARACRAGPRRQLGRTYPTGAERKGEALVVQDCPQKDLDHGGEAP